MINKWPKGEKRTAGFKLGMLKKLYRKKKTEWERLRIDFAILSYLTR